MKKTKTAKIATVKLEDYVETVEALAKELLSLMGTEAQAQVSLDKDNEAILVNIKTTDETGLLIGKRGETIGSIQSALGMMARKKTGEWIRIVVDIGDWQEREDARLKEMATQTAQRAVETNEPQYLYNLTPSQRRIIHLHLSQNLNVVTESQGEGRERFLIIRQRD